MKPLVIKSLLIGTALLVSACSSKEEPAPQNTVIEQVTPAPAPAPTTSTPQVDQSTLSYFNVNVGDRVYFETNSYSLTAQAQNVLQRQASWLQINPGTQIVIEGHADERGTRQFNLALGERRASAVSRYLASLGVSPQRIRIVSYGKERPVEACSSPACWNKNRRAVTVVAGAV